MAARDQVTALDITGPLPRGTTVLEASAGTGKTHTITSLVLRHVAEGVAIGSILVITFTRAAATELRTRIRQRLHTALRLLRSGHTGEDPVVDLLARSADVAQVVQRLREALDEVEAATIATIHEFAGTTLSRLGLLSGHRPDRQLTSNIDQVLHEVTDDIYLAMFAGVEKPPMSREKAHTMLRLAVANPHCPILPDPATSTAAHQRVAFVQRARVEVERRLRDRRIYTYDDIISGLHQAIRHPDTGAATAARLREMYRTVMVDEFQDTDPGQWEIIKTAFHGHCDVVLIGDPKQAIYGFRGGDVHTYLRACGQADQRLTLDTNWRCDAAVIDAVNQMFSGVAMGEPQIVAHPVRAAHLQPRLTGPDAPAPVQLRVLPEAPRGVGELRDQIREDLAVVVSRLLTGQAMLSVRDGQAAPRQRRLRADDIAVLVRSNWAAGAIARHLTSHGIPAVVSGTDPVLSSEAARTWEQLLATLLDPQPQAIHRLALGPFIGWELSDLVNADAEAVSELFIRVRSWAQILHQHGVAALAETVLGEPVLDEPVVDQPGLAEQGHAATSLAARTISVSGSPRLLTDLRQVGEVLHRAEQRDHLSPALLHRWLQDQPASSDDEGLRTRMAAEGAAVRVLTMHAAKGLEFPVVLLPDVADRRPRDTGLSDAFVVHDAAGERQIDVGGQNEASSRQRYQLHCQEEAGEDLRLLYVAMTRASRHLVMWWSPHRTYAPEAPLHRLLCGAPGPDGTLERAVPTAHCAVPAPAGVEVHPLETGADIAAVRPDSAPTMPVLAHCDRTFDTHWRRTSYSGLTADLPHGAGSDYVTDEPDTAEPQTTAPEAGTAAAPAPAGADHPPVREETAAAPAAVSVWDGLPMGARFGTMVHDVLESWDPATGDFLALVQQAHRRLPVPDLDAPRLARALEASVTTSLGGKFASVTLADIAAADRLNELDFELPMGGGDRGQGRALVAQIADVLEAHLEPDDPVGAYAQRLRAPGLGDQVLRGFLTGSIDAVLRIGTDQPQFVVVDYKTNWLGPPPGSGPLQVSAYAPAAVHRAMADAHYPLQAMLYQVALHRYLAWRLPGYDPDIHLGGVRYLFVRGMNGPHTPRTDTVPHGVFTWEPPAAMVTELADLITEGRPHP